MPTGPSDSPASDQSLSPEQRERRMLALTRWILALCLLVAGATLLKLVATVIRYAFGFDIVMRLETNAPASAIRHAHQTRGTDEYEELAFVPISEITAFLDAKQGSLAPVLRPMLQIARLI